MIRITTLLLTPAAGLMAAFFMSPLLAESETAADSISVVTASATADRDDGSDYFLDANMALPHQRRLILSLGQLYIKSSESDQTIEPFTALLGVETEFDAKIPLGMEIEYWDDQENIDVKTLRGTLGYEFDKANISIKPQIREFNFNRAGLLFREFSSEGFTLNLGVQALDSLYLYGEYSKHYYSDLLLRVAEVALPNDLARLKLLSSVGFADHVYQFGGSIYLTWGSLSGYWIRSVSAIDQTKTYSYGGTVEFDVFDQFSLGLSLGTQSAEEDYPDFVYGTLALSYYW
jgi:hypothetical protein